jgi:hypothetical protein
MKTLLEGARSLSPYLLVELLLPGGSIIALLLWLFRHRSRKAKAPVESPASRPASGAGLCAGHC